MREVFNNITIVDRNSFHIDVNAKMVIEYSSDEDLLHIFTHDRPLRWIVLSGGNNILFTRDVEETILTPKTDKIEIESDIDDIVTIKVDAGVEWDDVVEWCVERELWGVENLSLIPGKAGAAPIQNIGAYGSEVCDVITHVDYFDTELLTFCSIEASKCEFAYRNSIFKGAGRLRGRAIITAIHLKLSKSVNPQLHYADLISRVAKRGEITLRTIREVICEVRREKLPDTSVMGNAGSFFKNPIVKREVAEHIMQEFPSMPHYAIDGDERLVKLAAGWLIENAHMKGYRAGRAGVHAQQALVLVNFGGATGTEILDLAKDVQRAVRERFGVEIETEVNIL